MTRFILVRHGKCEANINETFAGHTDAPLSELGFIQASKSADYIKENFKIDLVFASDLKRAFNTGKTIADKLNLNVIENKNLREIYAGKWEGLKFSDILNQYPETYKIWKEDIGNAKPDDGETVSELQTRIINELKSIAENSNGKTVLIATHATPIRALACYIKGWPLTDMKNIPWVSNASITVVNFNNGKFEIETEGYDEHLGEIASSLPKNV